MATDLITSAAAVLFDGMVTIQFAAAETIKEILMLKGDPRLNEITEKIIGCAYKVGHILGAGFLEKVYENALAHELRKAGLPVEQQVPVPVWYDRVLVGDFVADLVVCGEVLIELKARAKLRRRALSSMHQLSRRHPQTDLPADQLFSTCRNQEVHGSDLKQPDGLRSLILPWPSVPIRGRSSSARAGYPAFAG